MKQILNRWQIFDRWHVLTNCVLALTGNYSIENEYAVQWIEWSLTNECPNHNIVDHIICPWIGFSLTQFIWIGMTRTDSINNPDPVSQAETGQCQISTLWERNALIYCIFHGEINIILLHWNKQHLESGIIKWRCRLLNENFHLVLMFTGFGSMHICIRLNIWAVRSTFWHKIN